MAYDQIVDSAALDGALTGIANAIRGKTGSTEKMTMEGMAAAIAGIQTGGGAQFGATLYDVFHDFCTANGYSEVEFTVVSDATSNTTVPHPLGRVPDAIVLYATAPRVDDSGYQLGVALTAEDRPDNRTMIHSAAYQPSYGLIGVLAALEKTKFRFCVSRSATEVTIRGGTGVDTKLLAGTYVLAVK